MLDSDVAISVVRNDLDMLLELTRPEHRKVSGEGRGQRARFAQKCSKLYVGLVNSVNPLRR